MSANNVIRKMKASLNPTRGQLIENTGLTKDRYSNNKRATTELKKVMQEGHDLLLSIRQQLTGQNISTKFIVQVGDKMYQIDEQKIQSNLILQARESTISNPFSLAYEIDAEMLKAQGLLNEENEITNIDIWQQMLALKPDYLEYKKEYWAQKGIHREYKNIYFDSKDAEIYELYQQQRATAPLQLSDYISLRQNLGGGGGYATPFFKLGDIGNIQIKFFKLTNQQKTAAADFARFSLIRDKFKQLDMIFSMTNIDEIKKALISFYTENEANISDEISKAFNKEAKEVIENVFNI